jgi:hypothetical protein
MKRNNIPDADYIRHAEQTGEPWPDYEEPWPDQPDSDNDLAEWEADDG